MDTQNVTQNVTEVADREWRSYVETLLPIGSRLAEITPDLEDPQLRQELHRMLFMYISHAYVGLFTPDPQYPDFWPIFNSTFNYAPCPEYDYVGTPIAASGTYKISGYRGSCQAVEFSVGTGRLMCEGYGEFGATLIEHDLNSAQVDERSGWFEVLLSAERPQGYTGSWWLLPPEATYVMVRQVVYDPLQEVSARFAIERLDCPAIRPRPEPDQIEAGLRQIAPWAENWTTFMVNWIEQLNARRNGAINSVTVNDCSDTGGVAAQSYVEGLFELQPDEALIYQSDTPTRASYWGIMLNTMLNNGIDIQNRQSSLNGRTAVIDSDGKFRAVISAVDPGVPNWLDTAGYHKGYILARWKGDHGGVGTPTVTKVKVADVRKHLPADTPEITPHERDAAIRARRRGLQMRRRW
jgi:hypothetical protein